MTRLATILLALGAAIVIGAVGDQHHVTAEDCEAAALDQDRGGFVDADTQQGGMRRDHQGQIGYAVARDHVLVHGAVGQVAETGLVTWRHQDRVAGGGASDEVGLLDRCAGRGAGDQPVAIERAAQGPLCPGGLDDVVRSCAAGGARGLGPGWSERRQEQGSQQQKSGHAAARDRLRSNRRDRISLSDRSAGQP